MFNDPNKWYPGCPPLDSAEEPCDLIVFRVVEFDPPSAQDFLSHFELGKPLPRKADQCRWRAISLYTDLADAKKTALFLKGRKNVPVLYIAKASLQREAGVVLPTPSNGNSHHSWWPCDDIDRAALFTVVDQV